MVAEPRKLNKALSVLVYGESKAGKSLLGVSGRAPRLLLDVESAARFLPINAIIWDPAGPPPANDGTWDTAVVEVNKWEDAIAAVKWLYSHQHPFQAITLDSVSELQYKFIESRGQKLQFADWGEALRVIRSFCNQLRDMTRHPNYPVNSVVVTSMAKLGEDKIWRPYLQGQMANVIPYLFDINGFLVKTKVAQGGAVVEKRLLHTEEAYPKTFIAGGRISGRIDSPFELNVVTGNSITEIGKNNQTVRQMIQAAFSLPLDTMVKAAPVPVSTEPVPDEVKKEVKTNG